MKEDDQDLVRQLVEQERARVRSRSVTMAEPPLVHCSELPEDLSGGLLSREWNYYRLAVGRLLAEGHEGKWVLVKGEAIVGIWQSEEECDQVRLKRFLMQPMFMKQVSTREPLLRGGGYLRRGRS